MGVPAFWAQASWCQLKRWHSSIVCWRLSPVCVSPCIGEELCTQPGCLMMTSCRAIALLSVLRAVVIGVKSRVISVAGPTWPPPGLGHLYLGFIGWWVTGGQQGEGFIGDESCDAGRVGVMSHWDAYRVGDELGWVNVSESFCFSLVQVAEEKCWYSNSPSSKTSTARYETIVNSS